MKSSSDVCSAQRASTNKIISKKGLCAYDVHSINSDQTCDILFMAELTSAYSDYVKLFKSSVALKKQNIIKTILPENIVRDVTYISAGYNAFEDKFLNLIYKQVAQEAIKYVKRDIPLPPDIIAQLIKLSIMETITNAKINRTSRNRSSAQIDSKCSMPLVTDEIESPQASRTHAKYINSFTGDGLESTLGSHINIEFNRSFIAEEFQTLRNSTTNALEEFDSIPLNNLNVSDNFVTLHDSSFTSVGFELPSTGDINTKLTKSNEFHLHDSRIDPNYKSMTSDEFKSVSEPVFGAMQPHIFIILMEFYDPNIIQELYKLGIALTAIMEFADINDMYRPMENNNVPEESYSAFYKTFYMPLFLQHSSTKYSYYINPIKEASSDEQPSSKLETSSISLATVTLSNLWSTIYDLLEGKSLTGCLENAVHVRICVPPPDMIPKNIRPYYRDSLELFDEVSATVLKIHKMKGFHASYLKALKISKLKSQTKCAHAGAMRTYKKLMDVIPPDCFTVGFLLHCLVEEVVTRSENHVDKKGHAISAKSLNKSSSAVEEKVEEETKKPRWYMSTKLLNSIKTYERQNFPTVLTEMLDHKDTILNPKMNLTLSKNIVMLEESNLLEFATRKYPQLSSQLLHKNLNTFKLYPEIALFLNHEPLQDVHILLKKVLEQDWRSSWSTNPEELSLLFALTIFNKFNNVPSPQYQKINKTTLELLFPPRYDGDEIKVIKKDIQYKCPKIALPRVVPPLKLSIRAPSSTYGDISNLYGSTNINTYRWYQNLTPITMLQNIQQANCDFSDLDYEYCRYNDSLIFRYHNNVNSFGINTTVWNEAVCTPVCFRDFCKYVIHENIECRETLEENVAYDEISFEDLPPAYDITSIRLQLTGRSIVFQSMDGYRVTVDNTRLLGDPLKLSVAVKIPKRMSFFMDYNEDTYQTKLFHFRFVLPDGTTVVFYKPNTSRNLRKNLGEKIYDIIERKCPVRNMAYTPGKVTRVNVGPWMNKNVLNAMQFGNVSCLCETPIYESPVHPDKELQTVSTKTEPVVKAQPKLDFCKRLPIYVKDPKCLSIVNKIKAAKRVQRPMFKICSSKLHKLKYVKPAKSYINIQMGKVSIRLLCKHPIYKIRKVTEVIKSFPVKLADIPTPCPSNNYYDFNLSLPSGLVIRSVPGIFSSSRDISLQYVDKGPEYKSIVNEYSRTYSRLGYVVKRKVDGSIQVLFPNGKLIESEIPYHKIKRVRKYICVMHQKINIIAPKSKSEKESHHTLTRRLKHFIGSFESRYYKDERNVKKNLDKKLNPFCYKMVTAEGVKYDVVDGWYTKADISALYNNQYEKNEVIYRVRDDNTTNLYTKNGRLVTEFTDGTRITTWYEIMPKLIMFEDDYEEECFFAQNSNSTNTTRLPNQTKPYMGWVDVRINYMYEHPKFTTVLYLGKYNDARIILSDNSVLTLKGNCDCMINAHRDVKAHLNDKTLTIQNRPCLECQHVSSTEINIKTLYYANSRLNYNTELLRTRDSFEKVFCVNYDGNCFRNRHFKTTHCNMLNCTNHCTEYQQLLTVRRNLSGTRLIDVSTYTRLLKDSVSDIDSKICCSKRNKIGNTLQIRKFHYSRNKYVLPKFHYNYNFDYSSGNFNRQRISNEPVYCLTMTKILWLPSFSNRRTRLHDKIDNVCEGKILLPHMVSSYTHMFETFANFKSKSEIQIEDSHTDNWASIKKTHKLFYSWLMDNKPFHPLKLDDFVTLKEQYDAQEELIKDNRDSASKKCDLCESTLLVNDDSGHNAKRPSIFEVLSKIKILESPSEYSEVRPEEPGGSGSLELLFHSINSISDMNFTPNIHSIQKKIIEVALLATNFDQSKEKFGVDYNIAVANDIIEEIFKRNLTTSEMSALMSRLYYIELLDVMSLEDLPCWVLNTKLESVSAYNEYTKMKAPKPITSQSKEPTTHHNKTGPIPLKPVVRPVTRRARLENNPQDACCFEENPTASYLRPNVERTNPNYHKKGEKKIENDGQLD